MQYFEEDVPEARFSYDLSPMAVVITRKGKKWYEFITSICALIGGTFTVVGLISGFLSVIFKSKKIQRQFLFLLINSTQFDSIRFDSIESDWIGTITITRRLFCYLIIFYTIHLLLGTNNIICYLVNRFIIVIWYNIYIFNQLHFIKTKI